MFPRQRLDGLGDAIYGVSMTLLVLDIRIPDAAHATTSAEFLRLLHTLWPHILPYVISFGVLSSGWLSSIRVTHRHATFPRAYVAWWRPQLLLVTATPFTTMTVARFSTVPLAVALYATNIGLVSLCAWRMLAVTDAEDADAVAERRAGLIQLMMLSLLAIVISPWLGAWALVAYLLKRVPLRRLRKTGPVDA